jgi:methylated-DNA-[protein]-cysteine S-methyltransferase
MLYYNYINTPPGELEICANDIGVVSVLFVNTNKRTLTKKETSTHPLLLETEKQLNAYFNNTLKTFDLPLSLIGTEFQQQVWNQLITIPFGKTISYLELAKQLGDEKCIRAAASANGKNPISIIIPCHRVIGSNGALVGYSGNIERKAFLLKHEGAYQDLFS